MNDERLPGRALLSLARRFCAPDEVRRVIEPSVADLQAEWLLARARGRGAAFAVRVAWLFHFARVLALLSFERRSLEAKRAPLWVLAPAILAALAGVFVLRDAGDGVRAFARNQLVYLGIGIALAVVLATSPRALPRARGLGHAASASLLGWLVLAAGESSGTVRRWLSLGPLRVEPGQLARPLFVLAMAALCTSGKKNARLLAAAALVLVAAPFVVMPDLVSVCVLGATAVAAAWASPRESDSSVLSRLGVIAVAILLSAIAMVNASAAGSAPAAGVERLRAALVPGGAAPASLCLHTDDVLELVATRAGVVGVVLTLALLGAIVVAVARVAARAATERARLVARCAAAALGAALVAQIVAGEGALLVSYGGSSLVATFALLGLVARAGKAEESAAVA